MLSPDGLVRTGGANLIANTAGVAGSVAAPEQLVLVTGMLCDVQVFGPWDPVWSRSSTVHVIEPSFPSVQEACGAILSRAAPRFALVGFSLGGIVAMACAVAAPDRISHLGLVATNPYPPRRAQRQQWRDWRTRCRAGRFAAVVAEVIDAMIPPPADSGVRSWAADMAHRVGPQAFDQQLQLQESRPDVEFDLSRISAPTLVLAGMADPLCPPAFQVHLADRLAHAHLELLPGCGHLAFYERPALTSEALSALLGGFSGQGA